MQTRWATVTVSPIRRGGSMGELLLPLSTAVEYTTNTSSMVINISMMNPPNGVVFGLIPFTPSGMSCSETWNKIAAPEVSSKIGHVCSVNGFTFLLWIPKFEQQYTKDIWSETILPLLIVQQKLQDLGFLNRTFSFFLQF